MRMSRVQGMERWDYNNKIQAKRLKKGRPCRKQKMFKKVNINVFQDVAKNATFVWIQAHFLKNSILIQAAEPIPYNTQGNQQMIQRITIKK